MDNELVKMTYEERAEFEAFKAQKAKKEAEAKAQADREAYKQLIDESIEKSIPLLADISRLLAKTKTDVLELFQKAISLKENIYGVKSDQLSHTFTNSLGTVRLTVGKYTTDDYRDTVNEGITIVNEFLQSLGKDDKSKMLVKAVLKLLSRDSKGTLKASRVMQLEQMANESGSDKFIEGVRIIKESYQPVVSKLFIRCETKGIDEKWTTMPLGMTEA